MMKAPKPIASRLRGVPSGLLCRSRDVVAELGNSWELWIRSEFVSLLIETGCPDCHHARGAFTF